MQIRTDHAVVEVTCGADGRTRRIVFESFDGEPITGVDLRQVRLADVERARGQRVLRTDDSFLSEIAEEWVRHRDAGAEHPTAEIGAARGWSLRTAQQHVTNARRGGYLPPGRRGKAR